MLFLIQRLDFVKCVRPYTYAIFDCVKLCMSYAYPEL